MSWVIAISFEEYAAVASLVVTSLTKVPVRPITRLEMTLAFKGSVNMTIEKTDERN